MLSNGKNIYPEEIEEALLAAIPLISEVVVYAIQSSEGEETELAAEIYPDYTRMPETGMDGIRDLLGRELARVNRTLPLFKQVRNFTVRKDEFPKTTKKSIKRFNVGDGKYDRP